MGSNYRSYYLTNLTEPSADDISTYKSPDIYKFAHDTRPGNVEKVGEAYLNAGESYGDMADFIRKVAGRLDDIWSDGEGSVAAQRQLAQLFVAAKDIRAACKDVGKPIKDHGNKSLAQFRKTIVEGRYAYNYRHGTHVDDTFANGEYKNGKSYEPPDSPGNVLKGIAGFWIPGDQSWDPEHAGPSFDPTKKARSLLRKHVENTQTAYGEIPSLLSVDLPPTEKPADKHGKHDDDGTGTSSTDTGLPDGYTDSGVPASYDPSGLTTPGSYPGSDPSTYPGSDPSSYPGSDLGSTDPGTGSGTGTDLSGLGNPTAGPNLDSGTLPTGLDGLGTGLGSGHYGSLPSGGSASSPLIGMKSGRSDGMPIETGNAENTAAQEAAAMRNAAASRGMTPMPFMPMGAGGQGSDNKDRERSIWAYEDEEIWGGDGDVTPPVIE